MIFGFFFIEFVDLSTRAFLYFVEKKAKRKITDQEFVAATDEAFAENLPKPLAPSLSVDEKVEHSEHSLGMNIVRAIFFVLGYLVYVAMWPTLVVTLISRNYKIYKKLKGGEKNEE
jgi:hypothetical protein